MHRRHKLAITAALIAAGLGAGAAQAGAEPPPATCPIKKPAYTGTNPRVERGSLEIGGARYRYSVLLPSGYATSRRSYPVLYWLHGASGNEDTAFVDPTTPRFMETLTSDQPVIVVMPEGGFIGMYSDWGVRGHQWETFHMRLVDHIDSTYRTRARRSQRAVAGYSMGGLGALAYAARHRGLFAAAASFSGMLDTSLRSPSMQAFMVAVGPPLIAACAVPTRPLGPWGDPVTGRTAWERHNPTALAEKLRGTRVHVTTGDGSPCDEEDARVLAQQAPTNPLRATEPMILEANETFHAAMTDNRIPHTYTSGCGIHSWRYWERSLTEWWPVMMKAFRRSSRASRPR